MAKYIETDRLILSAPKRSDVPALFGFLGDKNAMQHTHCDASLAQCRRRIAMHEWRRRHDGFAPWTIRMKRTGKIAGWGGLYEDPFDPGWGIELGYFFDQTAWGHGYATEFCRAALDFSDRKLKAAKVSAFAHPDNLASHGILRKMGFEFQKFVGEMDRNLYSRKRRA